MTTRWQGFHLNTSESLSADYDWPLLSLSELWAVLGGQLGWERFAAQPGEYWEAGAEEGQTVEDGQHVLLLDDDLPLYEEVVDTLPHILPGEREEGDHSQGDVVLGQVGGEGRGDFCLVQQSNQLVRLHLVKVGQVNSRHL